MCETDPVETTKKYKRIRKQLKEDIKEALEQDGLPRNPMKSGLCHLYWMYKKQVLQDKYGIAWQSPCEITPHMIFN
tara:strand:- start:130 stop:357 length:228 start_codon:yes stop_codon:yes gene_type:complete